MASGSRLFLWIWVVAGVVTIGSLAAVGLLPGQASNEPVSVRVTATTTTAPRRATSSMPATTVTAPSSTVPVPTSSSSGGPSTTAAPDTTVSRGTSPTTSASESAATTAPPASTGTTAPFKLDPSDPTCVAIAELLNMIDDPAVRGLIEGEYRNAGCAGG